MYGDLLQSSGTGKPDSKILTESDRFQANQYAADDEKQPAYYYYILSQYLNISSISVGKKCKQTS